MFHTVAAETNSPPQVIGIEAKASFILPRGDYRARPLDDRTELMLRIEGVKSLSKDQYRYDLHFIGFEPGAYSLAEFMTLPDGSRPEELGAMKVVVEARLPEEHDGQLNRHVPSRFPFVGGYRAALATLGAVWAGGFVVFVLAARKRRPVMADVAPERAPTFAERLRPLVERAAEGRLSVEGQAQLERLLMGYWRDRLNLPEQRMAEALRSLKAHPEAGELLREVEGWLHRPGGIPQHAIAKLLKPYRTTEAERQEGIAA